MIGGQRFHFGGSQLGGYRAHEHIHVVCACALAKCLQLLLDVCSTLSEQGGRPDSVPSGTVTRCTRRDAATRIAGIHEPLGGIGVSISPVWMWNAQAAVFRNPRLRRSEE